MVVFKRRVVGIIFVLILVSFAFAEKTTSDAISSIVPGSEKLISESINKVYDLGSNVLKKGYSSELHEKDAFRFFINQKRYSIVLWNISRKNVVLATSGGKFGTLNINEKKNVDLDDNGVFDIEISLQKILDNSARLHIKSFSINYSSSKNYSELFDVETEIINDKIQDSKDLTAYIKFTNFGEGPSEINIVYSVLDKNRTEVYRAVDTKVVYSQDSVIKTFDSLSLPPGEYYFISKIFYGKNQTAVSEKNFVVLKNSFFSGIFNFLIFLLIILVFYFFIFLIKKKRFKQKNE